MSSNNIIFSNSSNNINHLNPNNSLNNINNNLQIPNIIPQRGGQVIVPNPQVQAANNSVSFSNPILSNHINNLNQRFNSNSNLLYRYFSSNHSNIMNNQEENIMAESYEVSPMEIDNQVVYTRFNLENQEMAEKIEDLINLLNRHMSDGDFELDFMLAHTKCYEICQHWKWDELYNEIEMAYSYNKPIISFNIDNAEPKDEMAYFLKVSQWLPAFPDPEAEYETLIEDSLMLCNEQRDTPIITDFTNYKEEDLTRHKRDYISLILLFTPVYWASFIYMGLTANKKLWAVMGLVYLIPSIMILFLQLGAINLLFILHPILNLFILIFILLWIMAIIHGFLIRNEFLTRKSILRFTFSDEKLFEYLYDEYIEL